MVFGTVDQAFAAARSLHRRHESIKGVLPDAVGPFEAGSAYCANNISALRWVYATLSDSALAAHDLIIRSARSRRPSAAVLREATLRSDVWNTSAFAPADYTGLSAYVQAMCASDILTVSPAARHIAGQIFAPSADLARSQDLHGPDRRYAPRTNQDRLRSE